MIRRGIGVQSFVSAGGGTDADAQAFIDAAGITDATQQSAINTLVTDLKGYGIWSKMKAIYPFVGGTSSTHKWNLKDPRDLDAAFRLVFSGGITHSSTGAFFGGVNGFADTFLIPNISLSLNSTHISVYSRTNTSSLTPLISDQSGLGTSLLNIFPRYSASNDIYFRVNSSPTSSVGTNTSSAAFYLANRISSTETRNLRNNTQYVQSSSSGSLSVSSIYLSRQSTAYSDRECAFASIGDGLTDTEAANFYTSVQKYQTTLGRHVGTPIVADSDAQAFLNAAEITSVTEANAVDKLVTDLKTYGIWTKMKAIYPFVGGTSSTHKWNLKDPRDLDAAFRLVFSGGITHSSTGALFNGTNGWANTFLNANTNLTNGNLHLSFYSRTNNTSQNYSSEIVILALYNIIGNVNLRIIDKALGTSYFSAGNDNNEAAGASTTTKGFGIGTETSNSLRKFIKNGIILATNTTTSTTALTNVNLTLMGNNSVSTYSNNEASFASIGDGLTDTEAANLYTAVQAYQTTLSRNV